jgi:hypothetical protein
VQREAMARVAQEVGLRHSAMSAIWVTLGLYASFKAWHHCVGALVGGIPIRSARDVFFVTQLGKYLPGSIWPILAQADAARSRGLDPGRMSMASLLFMGLHVATGLVLAAVLLPWNLLDVLEGNRGFRIALSAGVLVGVIGAFRTLWMRFQSAGRRFAGNNTGETGRMFWLGLWRPTGWLFITWFCYGVSTFVIVQPVAVSTNMRDIALLSGGAFAVSWVAGVLIVFAPAGAGIREASLILALAPVVGTSVATSLAILMRLLHTMSDLALAALGRSTALLVRLSMRGA